MEHDLISTPQFCQQVSAESRRLLCPAGTVPEGHRDLRAGMTRGGVRGRAALKALIDLLLWRRLQVGANTMDNPLLKYSAKEYFFKASLCHFIVDELNAKASCASGGVGVGGVAGGNSNTLLSLCRLRLRSTRRCSRRSPTPASANCSR